MLEVAIIQRRLTDYRVPLFESLKTRLSAEGIRFRLLHGSAKSSELEKADGGQIDWAEPLATYYFWRDRLCWQPFSHKVHESDLVVITQETSLLANHLEYLRRSAKRFAFWGHGANFQGEPTSLSERFKRWSTRQADWYFAYTDISVELVCACGMPSDRITRLNNAVDLSGIEANIAAVTPEEKAAMRVEIGLTDGPVGLFIGSLYDHKRLPFLLQAAERIRAQVPEFQIVIVGSGPDQRLVEEAAGASDWIHYAGRRRGIDKATLLQIADVLMSPGAVGLGILDSFTAGLPMATTDCKGHGPEIAYLSPDNGVKTQDDLAAYSAAVVRILSDTSHREALVRGCQAAAKQYTLPNMVENFTQGILKALAR